MINIEYSLRICGHKIYNLMLQ